MYIDDLDTPVLVIDLDALEHNLERYQRYFDSHGIGLRPHIKTHKTLAIAARQLAGGAAGLTCQKVGEAETMVWGGLQTDIMIPYNILGKPKLDRLMALARQTRITASADSAHTVRLFDRSPRMGRHAGRRRRTRMRPQSHRRRHSRGCAGAGQVDRLVAGS